MWPIDGIRSESSGLSGRTESKGVFADILLFELCTRRVPNVSALHAASATPRPLGPAREPPTAVWDRLMGPRMRLFCA